MTTPATQLAPSLFERLGRIVAGLRRDLAFHAGQDRALAPLVLLLWNRLSRLMARVGAAIARAERGDVRPARSHPRRSAASSPPRDLLPRQCGWLARRVPGCAAYGEHLRLLLDDPEVQLLLATTPPLRRLLRPLWRMLRHEPVPDFLRTAHSRRPAPGGRPAPASSERPPRPLPTCAVATVRDSQPVGSDPPGLSLELA